MFVESFSYQQAYEQMFEQEVIIQVIYVNVLINYRTRMDLALIKGHWLVVQSQTAH